MSDRTAREYQIIKEPQENDVLLGRGSLARDFEGTKRYNELVHAWAPEHNSAVAWEDKEAVAVQVIGSIRAAGGRFLQQLSQTEAKRLGYQKKTVWVQMDSHVLLKKTKQALRDTWRNEFQSTSKRTERTLSDPLLTLQSPGLFHSVMSSVPQARQGGFPQIVLGSTIQSPPSLPCSFPGLYSRAHMVSRTLYKVNSESDRSLPCHTEDKKRQRDDDLDDLTRPVASDDYPHDSNNETESTASSSDQMTYTNAEQKAAEQLLSLFTEGDVPQFTAEDERREKAQLTEEERQSILADMFGDLCMISHQDKRVKRPEPGTIKSLLRDMRLEIDNIPAAKKPALVKAMHDASPHEFIEKRLEQFLQCEKKDARKAAERFVSYWEFRRKWFGEEKFCLPLTLDGAFHDDNAALEAGLAILIPGLDASGRSIIYFPRVVQHCNETSSALRAIWYTFEAALEYSNAAGGIVIIFTAKSDDFWQIDMKLAKAISVLQADVVPVTVCAAHQVELPILIRRVFMPIWLAFTDKSTRNRNIVHDVPRQRLAESFGVYGITEDLLPEELGGKCKLNHLAWLAKRRALGK